MGVISTAAHDAPSRPKGILRPDGSDPSTDPYFLA